MLIESPIFGYPTCLLSAHTFWWSTALWTARTTKRRRPRIDNLEETTRGVDDIRMHHFVKNFLQLGCDLLWWWWLTGELSILSICLGELSLSHTPILSSFFGDFKKWQLKLWKTTGCFFLLVRPRNDKVRDPSEILTLWAFLKGFTCNLTLSHFLGGPVKKTTLYQ